jgi:hypothetical protein
MGHEEPFGQEQGGHFDPPAPPGTDLAVPSAARMHDYYLGGKANYAADRQAAEDALAVAPAGRQFARANRFFLMRAVLMMADQGITQFLDLGAGIPTSPNVHELARAIHPGARVLYVDNDPVVTAHHRPLLAASEGVEAIEADIQQPASIFENPQCSRLIDFSKPLGVLLIAVLDFIADSDQPHAIVRAFADCMQPGSYLALSHITNDGTNPGAAGICSKTSGPSAPAVFRPENDIRGFFAGFQLADPGLTEVTRWSPRYSALGAEPRPVRFLAGIGAKT